MVVAVFCHANLRGFSLPFGDKDEDEAAAEDADDDDDDEEEVVVVNSRECPTGSDVCPARSDSCFVLRATGEEVCAALTFVVKGTVTA